VEARPMPTRKAAERQARNGFRELPRPFLKWAGGKHQLEERLLSLAPADFRAYHETFLGGGAIFFALFRAGKLGGKKVYLSDINSELIATFTAVRDDVDSVIACLEKHKYDQKHYYSVRAQDPWKLESAELAARMIFLNRTGFNGLYRVNSRGEFNVPFGRYKNPLICDRDNLEAVSKALQEVELRCESFEQVLGRARNGDFVYFDPPYVPLSKTANFVGYVQDGFDLDAQERLAEVFEQLSRRGVFVMLSNSDTPWVSKRYRAFRLLRVFANRQVNSRSDQRGPISELVVLSW
jgi:DNA adenine methylase